MRLDLFLKQCCLVPRRAIAKELCQAGKVILNHHPAKASASVVVGDVLEVSYRRRRKVYEVLELPPRQFSKKLAPALYRLTSDQVESLDEARRDNTNFLL